MSRLPGNFNHHYIGNRKKNIEGWRDFDPLHPDAAVFGNGSSHALTQLDTLTVNTNREIVATFKNIISSAATTMPESDVYSIPLTNKDGKPITFADSFALKVQIEIISASGDIDNATNKQQPFFGMGFGQHADIGDSSNHYTTQGLWLYEDNSGFVRREIHFKTTDADTHTTITAADSANKGKVDEQYVADFFVGPLIGATNTDDDNVVTIGWFGENASGSYERHTGGPLSQWEISNSSGAIDVDTQVYLYAFFGSARATDGSNAPAVVTCRMRYLVQANVGKDGTGAA